MENLKKQGNWVVLKFGGTSVATLKCWQKISNVIKAREKEGLQPFVVCSAITGVSNLLEKLLLEASQGKPQEALSQIENKHKAFAEELGINSDIIQDELNELKRLATGISMIQEISPKVHAQVLSFGELALTKLASAYLNKNGINTKWLDAREHLISEENPNLSSHRNILSATCNFEKDEKLIKHLDAAGSSVVITQGFIAGNTKGETVLLGRGGSDVSGAYFATKLNAARCEIWTDVPGMFTANPHQVPTARLIRTLDYEEAQEIASLGAKVLHPRCLAPVRRHNVPLHIYSLEHADFDGTVVSSDSQNVDAHIKAISTKNGITIISMETVEMWHQVGFLAEVFNCFKKHGLSIDLVSTSETNVTVTLDQTINALNESTIKTLIDDLKTFCQVKVIESCALVSLVGRNVRSTLHQISDIFKVFEEQRIYMVSQAANDLNLTFVVDEEQASRLVQELHGQLFRQDRKDKYLGPTWKDIVEGNKKSEVSYTHWWYHKKNELLKLAAKKTPLYVYDEETVDKKIGLLKSISAIDKTFYSIKANSNSGILEKCYKAGLGFECVSPQEIRYALKLFPKIDRKKILFTPNFAAREEYELAFKEKTCVTLDNIYPLEMWPEVFKGRELLLRIDPGEGRGHHKYVHTAGAKAKFGIWPSQLGDVKKLAEKHKVKIIGLHAHVGSNIFKTDTWSNTAQFLCKIGEDFPEAKFIDVGGGLGVVEKPGQSELDITTTNENLKRVKNDFPRFEFWIEPGRFIVANAGVLLAKVTQTKQKGDYHYIGTNAGMNSLIRPALYGAYHQIVNLSRIDEKPNTIANIVGPICESGDILGYAREMVEPNDGDIILIDTVGAYGRVMSSNYNMREPAEEYFLSK